MKNLIILFIAAVIGLAASAKEHSDTTVCFTVNPPMSCSSCENKIKTNLRFEKGVKEIDASAAKGIVAVKFDPAKTSVDRLVEAFKKVGYVACVSDACKAGETKAECGGCGSGCCGK